MKATSMVTFRSCRLAANGLLLHFLLFCVLQMVCSTSAAYPFDGTHISIRAIRRGLGFKHYGLQTARGFGKRGSFPRGDGDELVNLPSYQDSAENELNNRLAGVPGGEFYNENPETPRFLTYSGKSDGQKNRAIWGMPVGGDRIPHKTIDGAV